MTYLKVLKKHTPLTIKKIISRVRNALIYRNYDSSLYWRKRAEDPDQAAVLWKNQEYNQLYRQDQKKILVPYFTTLPAQTRVLDIGCGIGAVAKMLSDINPVIQIDAVDFQEMVEVAQRKYPSPRINYIACEAENYLSEQPYSIILSSGCYSAIRDIHKLEQSLHHATQMLEKGGLLIMIDPFHRWNYLARAKYGTRDVKSYLSGHGATLESKSGILFWPYREWLANSKYTGDDLAKKYRQGEKLLSWLGQHFWADYKILIFRKS